MKPGHELPSRSDTVRRGSPGKAVQSRHPRLAEWRRPSLKHGGPLLRTGFRLVWAGDLILVPNDKLSCEIEGLVELRLCHIAGLEDREDVKWRIVYAYGFRSS